jgi:hypothetical protein
MFPAFPAFPVPMFPLHRPQPLSLLRQRRLPQRRHQNSREQIVRKLVQLADRSQERVRGGEYLGSVFVSPSFADAGSREPGKRFHAWTG